MNASTDRKVGSAGGGNLPPRQMLLFGVEPWAGTDMPGGALAPGAASNQRSGRRILFEPVVNPHLLAARRLARKIRQLPERSAEETLAGLAICHQLKAYLRDHTPIKGVSRGPKTRPAHAPTTEAH